MKKNQATLRLVVDRDAGLLPRKYCQSTSGRITSAVTLPPDSRSISMASDSPQVLAPQATLRRCPTLVLHRSANDSRSADDNDFKNSLSFMSALSPNGVSLSTLNGDFTKRCDRGHALTMSSPPISRAVKARRIKNLKAAIEEKFGGNISAAARAIDADDMHYVNYLNGVLNNPDKSFGEKACRKAEKGLGYPPGTFDLDPDAPKTWPFKMITRERYDKLADDAHTRIEGALLALVIEHELQSMSEHSKKQKR